jgi:hypothetical protein
MPLKGMLEGCQHAFWGLLIGWTCHLGTAFSQNSAAEGLPNWGRQQLQALATSYTCPLLHFMHCHNTTRALVIKA